MIEIRPRPDGQPQSSSHYHDLADLATLARTTVVNAHALTRALRSEADRRGLQLPDRLAIPDPTWGPGLHEWHETTPASPTVTSPKRSEPQPRSSTQPWL